MVRKLQIEYDVSGDGQELTKQWLSPTSIIETELVAGRGGVMNGRVILTAFLGIMVLLGPLNLCYAQSASDTSLRPGDVLRISIWPNTELSGEFTIEETGYVYLPQLEAVQTSGVSIAELRTELRRRYGQTVRNPVVSITPMYRVSVTGAVQRPGVHMITPTHTLFDVIGMSGGLEGNADAANMRIVRTGQVIDFDALRALETGQGMDAVQLRSGDHIVVPGSNPFFTWRNVLTFLQTVSLIAVTVDRLTR